MGRGVEADEGCVGAFGCHIFGLLASKQKHVAGACGVSAGHANA